MMGPNLKGYLFLSKTLPLLALLLIAELCLAQLAPEPMEGLLAGQAEHVSSSPEPGLLFYLSGDKDFTADFAAGGQDRPNYLKDIKIVPDGAFGSAFQCADDQLMSYWAPGNIYAQRGTISFFWRSRYPVGKTPFPIFRVGYADHTSWDMVWLRIDYNGAGFDAFVTDIGLTRTRVSHYMDDFPQPDKWVHIALSWDETEGIRFYVDGRLVEKRSVTGNIYDTGLDQFGPHSRIISPYQVQSQYNFVRGGDMDELRIYDRMLSDSNIYGLFQGKSPRDIPEVNRNLDERRWREEWWTRHGWNLPNEAPPLVSSKNISVRKVEIHDAYDIKRWFWKANDGIRETTWPGVYNMSRLPGRYDYFVLPDWDAYSRSGQTIKFQLPEEPWNHVEIWGKAWGQLTYEQEKHYDNTFAVRSQEQIKSYHRLPQVERGGTLRFDNALIEEPIGELGVYYVHEGKAPIGSRTEVFNLYSAPDDLNSPVLEEITSFVNGRYPIDERTKMVGIKEGESPPKVTAAAKAKSLPILHIMIPYTNYPNLGLDGVELELSALSVSPTHNGTFPMNVRIKDPLWPMRDLLDFSFSIRPNQAHTLWFDTRDRILPDNRGLYITLEGAGADLTPAMLRGARVKLVYKPDRIAREEHELDRFTQVRDLYGFLVEEYPRSPRLNLYNRFIADNSDLLRVSPDHWLGKAYKYDLLRNPGDMPDYQIQESPKDVPGWAFYQTEYLDRLATIVNFYIDERQIGNGEFGGGLSDDDDLTFDFVGTALMGIEPDKTLRSLRLMMGAYYDQDRDPYDASLRQRSLPLFTNGLSTIQADLLHAYEEGVEAVGQLMQLDYGNPLYVNKGMEISKAVLEKTTLLGPKGDRLFRSRYYGGTSVATESPWEWSGAHSYNMLHTAYNLTRFNGNPRLSQMIPEMANGLLAHRDKDGNIYTEINSKTGEVRGNPGIGSTWQVFKSAYDLTGDKKYLGPISGRVQEMQEILGFDRDSLVERYKVKIKDLAVREFINTKGSLWIDRVKMFDTDLQADRLGGVALSRIQNIYAQNHVSWKIDKPYGHKSLAFFLPRADRSNIQIIAYNLEAKEVTADMGVWDIGNGLWKVRQGVDSDDDQKMDSQIVERTIELKTGNELKLAFPSHATTIVELELVGPSKVGYSELPDMAINEADIKKTDKGLTVRVYSLGSVDTPRTALKVTDGEGRLITTVPVPSVKAPLDLIPKWVDIDIAIPAGTDLNNGMLQLDPEGQVHQITKRNDSAIIKGWD